ncbi:MAG: ABC transporter permease, partial [Acidimicrobiales bacterium]
VQAVVIVAVGLALGWSTSARILPAVVLLLIGTVAFAGIGLLMAGTMRGELVLAAANGLYLVLLLLGGMVIPLDRLPAALRAVARALPSAALSDALHGALSAGASVPGRAWVVLALWALVGPALAARAFRWE